MRIDPAKLSEPLAHILGAGATDAASGQKTASAAVKAGPESLDRLDAQLLKRLRANATADAATSVVSFQDAHERIARIQEQMAADPAAARAGQGSLDPSRVRGLLD